MQTRRLKKEEKIYIAISLLSGIGFAILAIIMSIGLTGCGSEPSSKDKAEKLDASDTFDGTMYLDSKKQLPECTEKNETQLAYVKKERTFYACESLEWVEVSIEGERGTAGKNGSDAPVVSQNEWIDPVTGLHWVVAGQGLGSAASSYCGNGYRLASSAEIIDALENGLQYKLADLSVAISLWNELASQAVTDNTVKWSSGQGFYDTVNAVSSTNTVVCVQE